MERLMNVENECSDSIGANKVQCAMNCMKIEKAGGLSGVAIELFKNGGDKCLKPLTNI